VGGVFEEVGVECSFEFDVDVGVVLFALFEGDAHFGEEFL
jgi:hypothetical protein